MMPDKILLYILERAEIGLTATDLYGSVDGPVPKGSGPFVNVSQIQGPSPDGIHNSPIPTNLHLGFQVMTRASSPEIAWKMANRCLRALCKTVNAVIGQDFVQRIKPLQSPFPWKRDEDNRSRYIFHIVIDMRQGCDS